MAGKEQNVLLLQGTGYYDERRPFSTNISALYGNVDPLGIRIVSQVLGNAGIQRKLMQMVPGKIDQLEKYIAAVNGVFVSSRFYDIDMAQQVIEIANRHNVPVVAGGYGPTFNSSAFENAIRVTGEAEWILPQLVNDFLGGHLKPEYDGAKLPPYDITRKYIRPDRGLPSSNPLFETLFRQRRVSQEWQRGCWSFCTYCSVARLQKGGAGEGKGVRVRSVSDIISELESMDLKPGDFLFLADNNTALIPREQLLELFHWIKEHRIRFITEATVLPLLEDLKTYGEENSLLNAMSPADGRGGCFGLAYGADEIGAEKVPGSQDKERNLIVKAAEVFRKFGIPLNLMFIVGLDTHTYPDIFFQVAHIAEEATAPVNFFHIATPYRGTVFGNEIYKAERVFEKKSTRFNHRTVTFIPDKMSIHQLEQGYYWLLRKLHSPEAIANTARRNFNMEIYRNDLALGTFLSGLPWGLGRYLSITELEREGFIDKPYQRYLDGEYSNYLMEKS